MLSLLFLTAGPWLTKRGCVVSTSRGLLGLCITHLHPLPHSAPPALCNVAHCHSESDSRDLLSTSEHELDSRDLHAHDLPVFRQTDGTTPLAMACARDREDVVKLMLGRGASTEIHGVGVPQAPSLLSAFAPTTLLCCPWVWYVLVFVFVFGVSLHPAPQTFLLGCVASGPGGWG